MNPLLKKHLDDLEARLADLENLLTSARARADEASRQRQALLEDQLRQRKQISTLQHKEQQYDTLLAENQNLAERHAQLRQHARQVLSITRALGTELRQ